MLPEKRERSIDPVVLILAFACALTSFLICRNMLGMVSHVADETSYLFQGRIFASGNLWLTPPPIFQAFFVDHIIARGNQWCSVYSPGWPLILSLGWLIKLPWIINPIVTGIAAIGVWRLALLLYDRKIARLACALFCISPFVLMTGSGSMSHMATLCISTWSVAELIAAFETQKKKHYIIAGVLAGYALITRPFTSIFLLFPAFLWSLITQKKFALLSLVGFLPVAALGVIYNQTLFGSVIVGGYQFDPTYSPVEFSVSKYYSQNIPWYFFRFNDSIWQWPWPDLLILIPLIFYRPQKKSEWIPLLCTFSLIAVFSSFSYKDVVYSGPRYIFETVGFLSIFAARSIAVVFNFIQHRAIRTLILLPLLIFPPLRALPLQIRHHSMTYHGQNKEFVEIVKQAQIGENALILLTGDPYTLRTFFLLNHLEPQKGGRVYMREIPEKRNEIFSAYPRKEIWRMNIQLEPLPGINFYTDRWRIKQMNIHPIKHPNLKKNHNNILHGNQ